MMDVEEEEWESWEPWQKFSRYLCVCVCVCVGVMDVLFCNYHHSKLYRNISRVCWHLYCTSNNINDNKRVTFFPV